MQKSDMVIGSGRENFFLEGINVGPSTPQRPMNPNVNIYGHVIVIADAMANPTCWIILKHLFILAFHFITYFPIQYLGKYNFVTRNKETLNTIQISNANLNMAFGLNAGTRKCGASFGEDPTCSIEML